MTLPLLFSLLLLAISPASFAVQWPGEDAPLELQSQTQFWVDESGEATIGNVLNLPASSWQQEGPAAISHGFVDEPYWFRTHVRNPTNRTQTTYLEIGYPLLRVIDFHVFSDGKQIKQLTMGNHLPFGQRPVKHRNFVVPLELEPGQAITIIMRVETSSSLQLPLRLWNPDSFLEQEQADVLFYGFYFGIAMAMVFYHVFVYLFVRERVYLHYLGYITAMPLFLATLDGLTFQFLWPGATWWNNQLLVMFLMGVVVFGSLFTASFLSIDKQSHPVGCIAIKAVVLAALAIIALALVVPFGLLVIPYIIVGFIACGVVLTLGITRAIRGDRPARFYTMAWCFMLLGGIILTFNKFTLLPNNIYTQNAVQVGSALGFLLLSIAVADQLNRAKRVALEAQKMALRVQEEANSELEHRVQERTQDLEIANQKLMEFSTTDTLTGLRNRGYFDEMFPSYCVEAFRHKRPLSVLMLDIDHFKSFNDNYGHLVGDECLRTVASILARMVTRPQDMLARFGGEEFVVVLPDTYAEGAHCVAEKIRRSIADERFRVAEESVQITLSIGVSSQIPGRPDISQELFEDADKALYTAKRTGRNRVVVGSMEPAKSS